MKRRQPTLVELKEKAELAQKALEAAQKKKIAESVKAGNSMRVKT